MNELRRARFVLLCCVVFCIIVVIAQTAWIIVQDRALTMDSERKNATVAVRLLQEHATQTVFDAEREMSLVDHAFLNETATDQQTEAGIKAILAQHSTQNFALKPVQFADLQGESVVTHPGYAPLSMNLRQHPHVEYLLVHPEFRGTIIGRPYQGPFDAEWLLPMSRNLFSNTGVHLGLISIDIRLSYFADMYARIARDNDAVIALFHNKGEIIVRAPFDARFINRDITHASIMRAIRVGPVESPFEDQGTFDDAKTRYYLYRKVSGYPLTLVYGRDIDTVLQAWHERNLSRFAFSAATLALIMLLSWLLLAHIRRLQQTEHSLKVSENKFIALFQHSPLPLALIDFATHQFVESNAMFASEFGYAREHMVGLRADDIGLWHSVPEPLNLQALSDQAPATQGLEVTLKHRDGHAVLCHLSLRPISLNQQKLVIFAPINITEQRQQETESRELSQQLEQRVERRTARLEQARQQLEQALANLKETQSGLVHVEKMASLGSLVAGVAHELNTPIGTSMTLASTIYDHTMETLAALRNKKLSRAALERFIQSNTQGGEILFRNLLRAAELVSSFKQVAVDQSSNQRREFNLRQTLEELVMTLAPMTGKTPYTIGVEVLPNITCQSYPGPLGQIITNFVTNAITHAFEGREQGHMRLTGRLLNPDWVELTFRDDGVGIDEKHLKQVFDPFFTTKLGQGGSGLGMHIVYNLVTEILGGKIDIHSQRGHGTCLTVTFPRIAPVRQESAA